MKKTVKNGKKAMKSVPKTSKVAEKKLAVAKRAEAPATTEAKAATSGASQEAALVLHGTGVVKAPPPFAIDASMEQLIRDDLTRADIGFFSMLRAGLGLLVIKEWNEHGSWEHRLQEIAGAHRTPRTLRRYMQHAQDRCVAVGITPAEAWLDARDVDVTQVRGLMLEAGGDQRLLAADGTDEAEETEEQGDTEVTEKATEKPTNIFAQMVLSYIDMQLDKKAKKKEVAPVAPVTDQQRTDAAIDKAAKIVAELTDWLADGSWGLLGDDELESAMSAIRTIADRLREDYNQRIANVTRRRN